MPRTAQPPVEVRIGKVDITRPCDKDVARAMAQAVKDGLLALFDGYAGGRAFRVVRSAPAEGGFEVSGDLRGLVLTEGVEPGCELLVTGTRRSGRAVRFSCARADSFGDRSAQDMTRAAIGFIEITIDDRVSGFVQDCLRVVERDR